MRNTSDETDKRKWFIMSSDCEGRGLTVGLCGALVKLWKVSVQSETILKLNSFSVDNNEVNSRNVPALFPAF